MKDIEVSEEGLPYHTVPLRVGTVFHPYDNVRLKPRSRKIRDYGMKRLNLKQRLALQNFYEKVQDPRNENRQITTLKRESAIEAGYSKGEATKAMDRLLGRKTIVEELEKAGVTDAKIAQVIAEGLESEHPLKIGRPDPHAIHKFVQEANKIKDNYPETKIKIDKETKKMVVHFTAGNIEQFKKYQKMRRIRESADRDRS